MKKVAVVNDLSGFGKCSLTAAIPVLSAFGVQCCPLPTAVLTNQTGYSYYHCQDLTDMIPKYIDAWKANQAHFDAIYTGYVTGSAQLHQVYDFVEAFLEKETILLVDPVMGDDGQVYKMFTPDLLSHMQTLTHKADMITPNLTEAVLLAGYDIPCMKELATRQQLLDFAKEVGNRLLAQASTKQDVIITGIKSSDPDDAFICNLAVTEEETFLCQSHFFDRSFSGTGDLFASVMCGCKMRGMTTKDSMQLAGDFIYHSIADTMEENLPSTEGVNFEAHLHELIEKNPAQ